MPAPSLTPSNESILRKAHQGSLVTALAALTLPSNSGWLPLGHSALHGITKDHRASGSVPINNGALAEYLAIAAPTHCADGWSYLSRAMHSYFTGDSHSARHFAYYAELRAAQSILSAVGCGAFNSWNCVVDVAGQTHELSGKLPTHHMVWLALRFLVDHSAAAAATVARATSILGQSLPEIGRASCRERVCTLV